jgi:hypothetical protein
MTARTDRKPNRELLLRVIDSLRVSKNNLRRDPCGDWNIFGRCGQAAALRKALGFGCGCGGTTFTVAEGVGPHFAQLICNQCRRDGRWLGRQHL